MKRTIAFLAVLATLSGCNPNGVEQNVPAGYTRSCPLEVQQQNMNRVVPDFRQCQVVPMDQAAIMQQQMIQQQQGTIPQPNYYSQPYAQQPVVVQQHDSTGALIVGGALGYLAGRAGSGSSGGSDHVVNRNTTVVNNTTVVHNSPTTTNVPAPVVQQKQAATPSPVFQPSAARSSTTVTPMRSTSSSSGINLSKSSSSSFSKRR